MSRLDPDELTRLLTQAVEPIRPDPAAYQRIKEGVAWRRRWRAPGFALAGIAAVALVVLAVFAVQPSGSTQLVEPATPLLSSLVSGAPTSGSTPYHGGPGGTATQPPDDYPTGTASGTGASTSGPSATPTTTPSVNPSSPSAPPASGGSASMPPPATAPAMNGDVDGDGVADTLRLVNNRLEVTTSRGGVVTADLATVVNPLAATVVDLDGNGYGEIVVQTGAESNVKRYSLLRLASMAPLSLVDASGGVPLVAGTDALRGAAYGFRCSPPTTPGASPTMLTTFAGTSTDLGSTFVVVTTNWQLDGDHFVQIDSNSPGTSTSDRSQFTVGCGDLH